MTDRKNPDRTPEHLWDAVRREATDDEDERVAAMSDEELERDLVAKGIDVKALDAKAAEITRYVAERKARRAATASNARPPPRVYVLAFGALAAAALLALVVSKSLPAPRGPIAHDVPPIPDPVPTVAAPSPAERAAPLREAAATACAARAYADCERDLDEADALDPAGAPATEPLRAAVAAGRADHSTEKSPHRP